MQMRYPQSPLHTDDKKPKRIFATIVSALFMLNEIHRRYSELRYLLLEYHELEVLEHGPLQNRQHKIDAAYKKGNQIIGLAWDIVDWIEKVRKVLSTSAGIRRKEVWYQNLIHVLNYTQEMRHFLQHYDREINKFVDRSYPLMGTVFAYFPVENGCCSRLILAAPMKSPFVDYLDIVGFHIPEKVEGEIDHIHFSIADKFISLTAPVDHLSALKDQFTQYLNENIDYMRIS